MERDFPFSAATFRCRDAAKGSPAASLAAQFRVFPSLSRRLLAGERETRSATRVAPAARWLYRRRLGGKRDRESCQRAAGGTAGEPPALPSSNDAGLLSCLPTPGSLPEAETRFQRHSAQGRGRPLFGRKKCSSAKAMALLCRHSTLLVTSMDLFNRLRCLLCRP